MVQTTYNCKLKNTEKHRIVYMKTKDKSRNIILFFFSFISFMFAISCLLYKNTFIKYLLKNIYELIKNYTEYALGVSVLSFLVALVLYVIFIVLTSKNSGPSEFVSLLIISNSFYIVSTILLFSISKNNDNGNRSDFFNLIVKYFPIVTCIASLLPVISLPFILENK